MFVIYLCYEESSEVHIYVTEKRSLHLSICNCVNVYVIVQDHWEEGGGVCVCKGVLNYYYYRFKFWWLHHWNVNFLRWPTPKLWHWAHSGSRRPYNCVFIRGVILVVMGSIFISSQDRRWCHLLTRCSHARNWLNRNDGGLLPEAYLHLVNRWWHVIIGHWGSSSSSLVFCLSGRF